MRVMRFALPVVPVQRKIRPKTAMFCQKLVIYVRDGA